MTKNTENHTLTQEELYGLESASRIARLFASLIDGFVVMLVLIPILWLTSVFDIYLSGETLPTAYSLGIGLFSYMIFFAINGRLLVQKGQTLGKKIQKIRIVTFHEKEPAIYPYLVKRYSVYFLIGYIPVVGSLLSFINLILITGKSRQCGHDYLAETKVVKC